MKMHLNEFSESIQNYLRKFGNFMRVKYGHPVYIYGDCLKPQEEGKEPGEWAIRVEVPEADFDRIIGDHKLWEKEQDSGIFDVTWKWSDECHRQKQFGHKLTYLNIDFGIYPKDYARRHFGDDFRIKIDTREE